MKSLIALIKLTRWKEYYGKVIFITLLGVFLVKTAPFWQVMLLLAANLLNSAFAFMINNVEDAEDDALDKKKVLRNPISVGEMKMEVAQLATYVVGLTSLVLYSLLGFWIFMLGFLGLSLGFMYSYKRIRLKSRPVVDLVSHGFFMALVFFLTAVNLGDKLPHLYNLLWLGIPLYLVSVLGDISNEIRDYHIDRKVGIKNTASFINLNRFKHLLFYPVFILASSIFLFVVVYSSKTTKILLSALGMVIVVHYYIKWYRHKKVVCYYPYGQEILTFIGVLLFFNC
jgi:4-hydroxybenzoate polyprenyltransferase